jgi:hypothetical protein
VRCPFRSGATLLCKRSKRCQIDETDDDVCKDARELRPRTTFIVNVASGFFNCIYLTVRWISSSLDWKEGWEDKWSQWTKWGHVGMSRANHLPSCVGTPPQPRGRAFKTRDSHSSPPNLGVVDRDVSAVARRAKEEARRGDSREISV